MLDHPRLWYDVLHTKSPHSRQAWSRTRLVIFSRQHPDQEHLIAGNRKAAVVSEVWIDGGTKKMVESVLEAISEGQVEDLRISSLFPSTIDVTLLSQGVIKVGKCEIYNGSTSEQLEAILGAVSEGSDLTLSSLKIVAHPRVVAPVSSDVFGRAAVKLISLEVTGSTSGQIGEILTRLASTADSKLKVFRTSGYYRRDISHLAPDTVAEALLKLEIPDDILRVVTLSPGQVSHLMTKIGDAEDLRFTRLNFNTINIDTSQLAPDVVARAVTRLEIVKICATPAELQAIFIRLQFGGSKLKSLTIFRVDLSAVTTEVFLGVLRKVEFVEFFDSTFTAAQVAAMLIMLAEGSQGKLRKLSIVMPRGSEPEAIDLLMAAAPHDLLVILNL